MALVRASQTVVLEGYTYFKENLGGGNYIKKSVYLPTEVSFICDESEVEVVMEKKIKEKMEQSQGCGENFEGWSSYRTYCKPTKLCDCPNRKEFELKIDYIRDWKMQKILEELNANQFATLCKELGIIG